MEKFKSLLKKEYMKDILILGSLVLFYSIVSFIHLGSVINPQTFSKFSAETDAIIELEEATDISKIRYFLGDREGTFTLYGSLDNNNYEELGELEGYTLSWNDKQINQSFKYLKIKSASRNIG